MRLPPLSALRAFEAAARLSSFKKAAEELAVTATAISHRIRVLEEYLGRPLFVRKVRAVELTPDGQILFSAVNASFQTIVMAIEKVLRPHRTAVTLSTTPAFAAKWLVPKLPAFQKAHPDIDLNVHASNLPVDLMTSAVDLAIRYGHGHYEGVIATPLLNDQFAAVASPALLDRISQNAGHWPLIHFEWHRPITVDLTWKEWARKSGYEPSALSTGTRYSEESHAIQATVAGQGVALLSLLLVEEELRMGLLKVVSELKLQGLSYHLLRPAHRPLSEAAKTVQDWLQEISL